MGQCIFRLTGRKKTITTNSGEIVDFVSFLSFAVTIGVFYFYGFPNTKLNCFVKLKKYLMINKDSSSIISNVILKLISCNYFSCIPRSK